MHNLVKQRFVVQKNEATKIIDSNERMEKIFRRNDNEGFQQGLFAPSVEVEEKEEDLEPVTGIEALVADFSQDEFEEYVINEGFEAGAEGEINASAQDETIADSQHGDVEEAKAQAELILAQAREEAEQLKQNAYEEGVAASNQELEQRKSELEDEFQSKLQELEENYRNKFETMEAEIVDTLLLVISDVLHVEITDYCAVVTDLVKQTILGFESTKEIQVQVSDNNLEYVREMIADIREKLPEDVKFEVVRNGQLSDESCKIETELGIYECGFDAQLENLFRRIKVLSRQKD